MPNVKQRTPSCNTIFEGTGFTLPWWCILPQAVTFYNLLTYKSTCFGFKTISQQVFTAGIGYLTHSDRYLKVICHTLQITRSEKIQSYSMVIWYSLMLTIEDSNFYEKPVSQSPKITFHFIALITSKSVSSMVASGYISKHWCLNIIQNC